MSAATDLARQMGKRTTWHTAPALRSEPASLRLYRARTELAAREFWDGQTATWTDGAYTLTAEMVHDYDADVSWLGEFHDGDPLPGDVENPGGRHDANTYRWFTPGNPGAAEVPYFRAAGMGRHDAWLAARRLDIDAMNRARDPELVGVTVTAERTDGTGSSGESSLWAVDDAHPYPYAMDCARECAAEAIAEAEAADVARLARLCNVPPAILTYA